MPRWSSSRSAASPGGMGALPSVRGSMRVAAGPGAATPGTSGTLTVGPPPTVGAPIAATPPAAQPGTSNQSSHAEGDAPHFCFCTGGGAIRLGGIVGISWG